MAGKTLPVGSIVKIKEKKEVIVGIRYEEDDNRLIKSYVVVPYPVGYLDEETLRIIPASETEPVYEGYHSPVADPFLGFMNKMEVASELADAKTINTHLEKIYAAISEGDK